MSKLQAILQTLANETVVGATGKQLEARAEQLIKDAGVEPAFLNYGYKAAVEEVKDDKGVVTTPAQPEEPGFPSVICISIDGEVIHGVPDDRKFEDGMLVTLDMGIKDDGQFDDAALSLIVGGIKGEDGTFRYPESSSASRRLIKATSEALEAGVAAAKDGNTTHDIAKAIEGVAKKYELLVIAGYGGHGIGEELHMPPFIPNEVPAKPTEEAKEAADVKRDEHGKIQYSDSAAVPLIKGMRLAIEPMFTSAKRPWVVTDPKNKWTVKLVGGGLAAHFERTVTVA